MEKLLSTKTDLKFVPESYILPPDTRPGNTEVPFFETIPVIDLKGEPAQLIQQIADASKEYGFFQLINHGVEEKLLQDVLDVTKEFFELPAEDKATIFSDDPKRSCRLYTSIDYMNEQVHYWRDALKHPCHPLEEHSQFWPQKPAQYREVVGRYSVEVWKLSLCLMDLISKGLGLEPGYLTEMIEVQLMSANHYPACPDPSLTLGLPKHGDVDFITILLQEMDGLQVLKDGHWLAIKPLPNAFVVNIGHTLQIISNGKLKSVEHRVVTNQKLARTTVSSFIYPSYSRQIEPAQVLIKDSSLPLYRAFIFKDFLDTYITDTYQRKPPLERYKLQV
ncbi:Oxoglutarate/iron-dependent dioxygenase [Trema orientale]|uniref:Oxoglutarate/iron-dependent dioxygenase n=1 Tax=Trema orientale TaxID=63057 RepID=A0A2P5FBC5_TREOI|nr:Oxoglutarate/iron-dependent dioxygenase [Trema orientale]